MAIVTLNRKKFEKEVGKIDEKMEDRIAMFGTPVEEINESEIQIEVFPNRPDILSYHGFRRAFLAFLGKKVGLTTYKTNAPERNYSVVVDTSVKNIRPYTACSIIKGLNLDDDKIREIIDMQEKLHTTLGRKRKKVAIGIYPLEEITLPITFKAVEPDKIKFIPLESEKENQGFSSFPRKTLEKEMSGLEILQKHPAGKEYAHLLAGKEKFPVFVDAENKILSMPPIINSKLTGRITESTKNVFVECSGFDFDVLKKALNILVANLAEMGGKIYQMEIKYPKKEITPNLSPDEMKLSVENANKLLGLELNEKQVKTLIEKMGHEYSSGKVKTPSWRTDVIHEVDLIEDIAIAYGYENFIPEIPSISTIGEEDKRQIAKRKVLEILSGTGMLEVLNYHLTNRGDQFEKMGIPEKDFVEIENSKTEYNILRKDLSHYMLKLLSENSDSEYPQRIFEIGRVFLNKKKIEEKDNLSVAICSGNFTDVKQILEYLSKMLKIEISIQETSDFPAYFIDGRIAKILLGGKEIGFMGEVHPRILRSWKIKMPVALFEISMEEIYGKFS